MKDRNTSQKQNLSGLMVLIVFGVFAVCILGVLLSGTKVYDGLTARDRTAYENRTAAQYLSTRIHQAKNTDAVRIVKEDGRTVLCITELYDGEAFETRLYCENGWLCEQFLSAESETDPDEGERILEANALDGSIENGLLTLKIELADSGTQTVRVRLVGEEARP